MIADIDCMFLGAENRRPVKTRHTRQRLKIDEQKDWVRKYREQNDKIPVTQINFERENELVTGSISVWACKHKI